MASRKVYTINLLKPISNLPGLISGLESLKEFKADFNLNFFGRVDKDVAISKDQHFLYLAETVNPTHAGSSFSEISEAQINGQVQQLNAIQEYYKAKGFDEVLFSIIPNPVSVLRTENRPENHLIQRIKSHPDFRGRLIDPSEGLSKCHIKFLHL